MSYLYVFKVEDKITGCDNCPFSSFEGEWCGLEGDHCSEKLFKKCSLNDES